jgi:hypothetical protein
MDGRSVTLGCCAGRSLARGRAQARTHRHTAESATLLLPSGPPAAPAGGGGGSSTGAVPCSRGVVRFQQAELSIKIVKDSTVGNGGKLHFFLKCFLENEIFFDNLKFFVLIFSNFVFFASELDSESLSTLLKIVFKREASRVEGYVTPSCTEIRLSVRNLRKSEKI